jgi:ADP-ribose pyrophosphatase YjhB (NUDIX family)|tara:strand:+ start:380 stop:865 length:486 start_codon:yes stop_codon:yes gene_type:complete
MKLKQKLTAGITLINKKYKRKEFYHYFKEPDNVVLIPIIKGKFLIVEQKREPINKKNYEFPMGWIDKGETSVNASKRELLEETGYKSLIKPKKLIECFPDPGRGSRSCIFYYSNKIKKIQKPEKNIKIFFASKKKIKKLIKLKKFNNASHIAGFYSYINKI